MRIAFIGFGEAARAFTDSLRPVTGAEVAAYDILLAAPGERGGPAARGQSEEPGGSPESGSTSGPSEEPAESAARARALVAAAAARGVALAPSAAAAAAGAEIVFSAVTAGQSLEAVRPLVGVLGPGQVLIDLTSVSPPRKAAAAALLRPGGAAYVDMAVMGPVHPEGHRTPVLLAGDLAPALLARLAAWGFRFELAGPRPGDAAAVKMVRSLFVKGLEALTVQTLAAAAAAGCLDRVLASLAASFPGLGGAGFAAYVCERVATHGRRRAEEMREVAATLAALGFAPGAALAEAVADVQERAAGAAPVPVAEVAAAAAALHRALAGPPRRAEDQ